jgi:hypothetical protein
MPKEPADNIAGPSVEDSQGGVSEGGGLVGARSKPDRRWSLWNAGRLAQAETHEHPLGYEVRVYMNGSFLFSIVRSTRELADELAKKLKRVGMANGWKARPPTSNG